MAGRGARTAGAHGTTGNPLTGYLRRPSQHFHGLLSRVRDIGLPLISVGRVDPTPDEEPPVTPTRLNRTTPPTRPRLT